ncbi:MAG: H(+)/Cl(-) exchange transporter ClcA [Methylomonas sp.]
MGETSSGLGKRHRLIPRAVLLGLLTGSISVAFNLCVDMTDAFRMRFIKLAHEFGDVGVLLIFCYVFVAVLISAGLVIRFAPEASGSGIPHLKAVLLGYRRLRWLRVLVIKFFSIVIGNAGGMILGRGGPAIHMGGAIGQGLATLWSSKGKLDSTILVAAGGGAGLTAAFNAPLSGLTFVLEELERRCASLEFFAAAIACLSADMVCRTVFGQYPVFYFAIQGAPPLNLLIAFLPLGVLAAILGNLFTRTLLWGQKLTVLTIWPKLIWWSILAAALSVVAWYEPELLGGGQHFINEMLAGKTMSLQTVCLFFLIRFVLTIGSASSGVAGGIFMPILVLGALLGWAVGAAIQTIYPELNVDTGMFAVVGMAAYFSGVIQAPLTGIVLIIEMTQNYALIMPLFIACFTALVIAEGFGCPPVYEALLENDLKKNV